MQLTILKISKIHIQCIDYNEVVYHSNLNKASQVFR